MTTQSELRSMLNSIKSDLEHPTRVSDVLIDALDIKRLDDSGRAYEILLSFGGPNITFLTSHGILIGQWGSTKIACFVCPDEARAWLNH